MEPKSALIGSDIIVNKPSQLWLSHLTSQKVSISISSIKNKEDLYKPFKIWHSSIIFKCHKPVTPRHSNNILV